MNTKEENLRLLKDDLDDFLSREGSTNALLEPIAGALTEVQEDVQEAQRGLIAETATSKEQLEALGFAVQVRNDSQNLEPLRKEVLTGYRNITQRGTAQDYLQFASIILNVIPEQLELRREKRDATFQIAAPAEAVEDGIGGTEKAVEILNAGTASTFNMTLVTAGGIEYISRTEYENSDYDTTAGYADSLSDDGGGYSGSYE